MFTGSDRQSGACACPVRVIQQSPATACQRGTEAHMSSICWFGPGPRQEAWTAEHSTCSKDSKLNSAVGAVGVLRRLHVQHHEVMKLLAASHASTHATMGQGAAHVQAPAFCCLTEKPELQLWQRQRCQTGFLRYL